MEFVIATIPTVLGIQESSRLLTALRKENIPTKAIVVNQIVGEHTGDVYLKLKLKEQAAAMKIVADSKSLSTLEVIEGKLQDIEVRGLPALQYFGSTIWGGMPTVPAGELALAPVAQMHFSVCVRHD
jgi:arsenite-transporting ATPase